MLIFVALFQDCKAESTAQKWMISADGKIVNEHQSQSRYLMRSRGLTDTEPLSLHAMWHPKDGPVVNRKMTWAFNADSSISNEINGSRACVSVRSHSLRKLLQVEQSIDAARDTLLTAEAALVAAEDSGDATALLAAKHAVEAARLDVELIEAQDELAAADTAEVAAAESWKSTQISTDKPAAQKLLDAACAAKASAQVKIIATKVALANFALQKAQMQADEEAIAAAQEVVTQQSVALEHASETVVSHESLSTAHQALDAAVNYHNAISTNGNATATQLAENQVEVKRQEYNQVRTVHIRSAVAAARQVLTQAQESGLSTDKEQAAVDVLSLQLTEAEAAEAENSGSSSSALCVTNAGSANANGQYAIAADASGIYTHSSGKVKIQSDGGVWGLAVVSTGAVLYQSEAELVQDAQWQAVTGAC